MNIQVFGLNVTLEIMIYRQFRGLLVYCDASRRIYSEHLYGTFFSAMANLLD